MATKRPRHKPFISCYEQDIKCKEEFVRRMGKRIVERSVDTGNIDDTGLKTTTVRQNIRDEYISDATVPILLNGPRTWHRKHVDWAIGSSIRKTKKNPRCGMLRIRLPNHPNYGKKPDIHLLPPSIADNSKEEDPYALIYDWPKPWAPTKVARWIHRAFVRRDGTQRNNSRAPFALQQDKELPELMAVSVMSPHSNLSP